MAQEIFDLSVGLAISNFDLSNCLTISNFDLSVRLMRATTGRPYEEKREINKSRTNKISPQTRHQILIYRNLRRGDQWSSALQILIYRGVWVEAPSKRLPPNR